MLSLSRLLARGVRSQPLSPTSQAWFEAGHFTFPSWFPQKKNVGVEMNPRLSSHAAFSGAKAPKRNSFSGFQGSANSSPSLRRSPWVFPAWVLDSFVVSSCSSVSIPERLCPAASTPLELRFTRWRPPSRGHFIASSFRVCAPQKFTRTDCRVHHAEPGAAGQDRGACPLCHVESLKIPLVPWLFSSKWLKTYF